MRDGSTQNRTGWIVAAIAFLVPLGLITVRDMQIRPDTSLRIAADDPIRQLDVGQPQQRTLTVTWQGSTSDDPRIAEFKAALLGHTDPDGVRRGGAAEVSAVATPGDMLEQLTTQGIDRDEAFRRLTGTFVGRGGLKIALTDAGRESVAATTTRLVEAVREKLGIELMTSGPVESSGTDKSEDKSLPTIPAHDLQITWDGFHPQSTNAAEVRAAALSLTDFPTANEPEGRKLIDRCFLAPGSPVGVRIELSEAGRADIDAAVAAIDRAATAAEIPQVHLVGDPLFRAGQDLARKTSFWNPEVPIWKLRGRSLPLFALLIASGLACYLLRSARRAMALLVLIAATGVLTMALVRTLGAEVDLLLFGAPLLACLLVLSNGLSIADQGRDPEQSAAGAPSGRLATIFVLIAVAPLMISSTPVVRQLGMIGFGCAGLALLLGELVLPVLLASPAAERRTGGPSEVRWQAFATLVAGRRRLVGGLCLLLLLAGVAGVSKMQRASGERRQLLPESRLAADAGFVEENLTGTSPLDVIVEFSAASEGGPRFLERAEIVRAAQQTVLKHPAVIGAVSLADFLPVTEIPPQDASRRVRVTFNRNSNQVERSVQEGAIPAAESLLLAAPGQAGASDAVSERWLIASNAILPEGADIVRFTGDLNASLQQVLREHPTVHHTITGPAVVADGARRVVMRSLSKTSILACVFLMGTLIWLLRSPAAMLVNLLGNILPIVAVLGLGAVRGVAMNEEVLTVALVGLLVGVHSTTRLLAKFRERIQLGENHQDATRHALGQCGPAGLRFATVCVVGLMLLGRSELTALSQAARLLAGMIAASQLSCLILLPSLLSGRMGRWFEKALRPRRSPKELASDDDETPSPHVRFEPASRDVVRPAI